MWAYDGQTHQRREALVMIEGRIWVSELTIEFLGQLHGQWKEEGGGGRAT